jgi:S-adenosylmethionine decarboxylase proenzyme
MTQNAPLARHFLAEYYGCSADLLDDADGLRETLENAARAAKTTIIGTHLHKFAPQGVSGMVILAESHLAIHTWPELGFASIEIYVCGEEADPNAGHAFLEDALRPKHSVVRMVPRGDLQLAKRFNAAPEPVLA